MSSRVALVAGGSTGIGLATAKLLASKGYKVAISGLGEAEVAAAVQICAKLSPNNEQSVRCKPLGLACDYSLAGEASSVVERTVVHYGRLDVLIYCAGIAKLTDICDKNSFANYLDNRRVNLDAAIETTLAAVELLRKSKGCVVYVSSVVAIEPFRRQYGYNMTKAALSGFAKSVALELAPDVRVNLVNPGCANTPLYKSTGIQTHQWAPIVEKISRCVPDQRFAEPEDVAAGIDYLISDGASYVRGHELLIDGGSLLTRQYQQVSL